MTVPGRKVQTEIPRSEVDFKNYVLIDFFTTVLKIMCFKHFFFFVGNALFFHVQYPVMFVTRLKPSISVS